MIREILAETKSQMEKALKAVQHEMATIRTGRATTALLDGVRVDYYGSHVPLQQVASIGVPDPRLLTIQPWESKMIPAIEKAIMASGLGLMPSSDGKIIRLPIPQLTEERRRDLVKLVRKLAEEGRVAMRNARREANETLKDAEKEGLVTEDDARRTQKEVQELTDEYIRKVDAVLHAKESEIMEV